MALANYTDLKSSIAGFLNRDDLTDSIPTFISLAESQINRDIRHWRMETRANGQQSAGDQYMNFPADWVETIRLHLNNGSKDVLQLVGSFDIAKMRSTTNDAIGIPRVFCHSGGQIEFYPTPAEQTEFELLYFAKVPSLSSTSTNWLLSEAPDIYLYGSLLHTAPYLQDDQRLAVWAQLYSAAASRINEASGKAKYSGAGLRMKLRGLA